MTESQKVREVKKRKSQSQGCKKLTSVVGLIYAMLAALFSALTGFLVKYVKEATTDQTLLVRFSIQYLFMLPVMQWKRKAFIESRPRMNILIPVVGLSGAFASFFLYLSLNFLTVSDAIAIAWGSVALIGIFACIFLKEPCGFFEIVFSATALLGLFLISRPSFIFGPQTGNHGETNRPIGIILAITAMFFNTVSIVALRKLGKDLHYSISLVYHAICAIILSLVSMHFKNAYIIPCTTDVIYMTSSAFSGLLYVALMTVALQKEAAGPVTIVTASQVVITFLLEYFFLDVVPFTFSVVGACLVMASTIGSAAVSMRRAENET